MKKNFEELLIEHCAPTLARVKTANLFCYSIGYHENIEDLAALWNSRLYQYGIRIKIIKRCIHANNCLIYVFRENALIRDLNSYSVQSFLADYGYSTYNILEDYITQLSKRLETCNSFPHEIGLFLGYPFEDVIGFIENKGKNYHCSGCWKVYSSPQTALKCFERYKKCTALYKKLYQCGKSITQLTVAA